MSDFEEDIVVQTENNPEDGETSEITWKKKRKDRQRFSHIWNKFVIVNSSESIAKCNVCDVKLSFKSSVSNLKKHLIRKHHYPGAKSWPVSRPTVNVAKGLSSVKKPNLTQLSGLDGLIINVVADEGEDPNEYIVNADAETVENHVIYRKDIIHDYCAEDNDKDKGNTQSQNAEENQEAPRETDDFGFVPESGRSTQQRRYIRRPAQPFVSSEGEKYKRNRIMDLQLECLEIKKYNMQMEALMLEHQLNLPRSLFTEPLQRVDTYTRGTQTDVGGGNTKVFFVSDRIGGGIGESTQHLFTFRARLDESPI